MEKKIIDLEYLSLKSHFWFWFLKQDSFYFWSNKQCSGFLY